tara:strand:- start:759 stop:1190 length:432 start_codon:yes stop_codon:yes gene_type:complete
MALTILSPVSDIYRQDIAVGDNNLVDPTHLDCLVAGEWVSIESDGTVNDTSRGNAYDLCYQVFTEKGDYSAQALKKVTILRSHDYIAETDQVTLTPAAGTLLCVETDGTLGAATTTGDVVVAISLGMTGTTLKFQRVSPYTHN